MRELTNEEVNVINGGDFSVTINYTSGCAAGLAGGALAATGSGTPWGAAASFWGGAVAGGCFNGGITASFG